MSTSTSYAYKVRQEAIRREQERRAAADALHAAESRYAQLRNQALSAQQTWGVAVDVPAEIYAGHADDPATARARTRELDRMVEQATSRLTEQVVSIRVAQVVDALTALGRSDGTPISAADVLAKRESDPEPARTAAGNIEATLARQVARIDSAGFDAATEQRLQQLVVLIRESDREREREIAMEQLRVTVQAARDESRRAAARLAELERLERRLDGCHGPQAGAARATLAELRTSHTPIPSRLGQEIDAAVEAETHALQTDYIRSKLRDVLQSLNYEVGADFETSLAQQGFARLADAQRPGYGVQVRLHSDTATLNLNLIKGHSEATVRDSEVEAEFCADRERVLGAMAAVGIDARRANIVEAGELPIQVVPELNARRPESHLGKSQIGRTQS